MAHPGNINSYEFSDDTDVILRSSNNVDFYVIGAFLRHVSPVFKDMFALSTSDNNETKDDLPVVPLAEDSEIIRFLLDIIYPYDKEPLLSKTSAVWKVSKAAQKYGMNIIEKKLKRQIISSQLIRTTPLSLYAIAISLGWEDVATIAARVTLNVPLQTLIYVTELEGITGAGFFRFLEYRRRCENSKNPLNELLPPLRRRKDPIETSTDLFGPQLGQNGELVFASASEPYTRSELTDLILRTSNGVDFHVISALLRFSSPYFNKIFPLEKPVMEGGLAVINVQEDKKVLRQLLSFIYPVQELDIPSPELYAKLVFAARKYDMTNIEDKIRKHATASSLVTTEPLRVYAVASALNWAELAKTAALNTLNTPLQEMGYVDEMHLMTGAHLFRLMRFKFTCAHVACGALNTDTFQQHGFGQWSRYLRNSTSTWHVPVFDDKLPAVMSERLNACPRGSIATNVYEEGLSKAIAEAKEDRRFDLLPSNLFKILRCMQDTPKVVDEAVSKVDLLKC